MKVRIIKDRFGGMGWRAEPGVLHLGGVGTAGVESLSFALPEEWSGMAVTLHIEQEGGTLPQPVLLDESREVTIDRRFTAARQGLWMLLAQSTDGYTAMSCPARYDCYETIELSGTVEDVDPSVYAQFVALVQQAVNTAMNEGAAAKDAAKALGIECVTLNASELASQLAEEALPSDLRFPALLAAADRLGIQYIATGHHARVETDADGVSHLLPAADAASDESAALAALPQETLARLILPLGDFAPEDVAEMSADFKL